MRARSIPAQKNSGPAAACRPATSARAPVRILQFLWFCGRFRLVLRPRRRGLLHAVRLLTGFKLVKHSLHLSFNRLNLRKCLKKPLKIAPIIRRYFAAKISAQFFQYFRYIRFAYILLFRMCVHISQRFYCYLKLSRGRIDMFTKKVQKRLFDIRSHSEDAVQQLMEPCVYSTRLYI